MRHTLSVQSIITNQLEAYVIFLRLVFKQSSILQQVMEVFLTIKNKKLAEKAKRIRWFGIDRKRNNKEYGKMMFMRWDINIK